MDNKSRSSTYLKVSEVDKIGLISRRALKPTLVNLSSSSRERLLSTERNWNNSQERMARKVKEEKEESKSVRKSYTDSYY